MVHLIRVTFNHYLVVSRLEVGVRVCLPSKVYVSDCRYRMGQPEIVGKFLTEVLDLKTVNGQAY